MGREKSDHGRGIRPRLTPAGEEAVAQFWRLMDTSRQCLKTQEA